MSGIVSVRKLHGDPGGGRSVRAVTWYDAGQDVCWLMAAGLHDRFYDRVLALPTAQSEKSPKPNYFDGIFWREGPAAPGFRHHEVLPALTRRAEQFIEAQTSERIERLMTLLTPVLTIGLGAMVGGLIMSVMQAILAVNELAIR